MPIEVLRECVAYDQATGAVTWLRRPRRHFNSDRSWWQRNGLAGKPAGSRTDSGYVKVRIKLLDEVSSFRAHRIGWALTWGYWPGLEIDHVNRVRDDNRLENLRVGTHAEQAQNAAGKSRSGLPLGVRRNMTGSLYASIFVNGENHYLGVYDTPEQAHAAYLEAKARLHLFQPTRPA